MVKAAYTFTYDHYKLSVHLKVAMAMACVQRIYTTRQNSLEAKTTRGSAMRWLQLSYGLVCSSSMLSNRVQ